MGRHPGQAHRRDRVTQSKIVRWACPCCGTVVMISRVNLKRLFLAAQEYHGTNKLSLDIGSLPQADWTGQVSDEQIRAAVLIMEALDED